MWLNLGQMEVRRRSSAAKEPDGPILADGQESFKNLQKLLRSLSFVHLVENSLFISMSHVACFV